MLWLLLLAPLCLLLLVGCIFSNRVQSQDFFRAQYVNKANEVHRSRTPKKTPKKNVPLTPDCKSLQRKVSFGSGDELMLSESHTPRKLFPEADWNGTTPNDNEDDVLTTPTGVKEPESILIPQRPPAASS